MMKIQVVIKDTTSFGGRSDVEIIARDYRWVEPKKKKRMNTIDYVFNP